MFGFDSPIMIVYGLLTGLVFGFLLQKGGVTRYHVILGQFLLRDFTVLKVMLTAIVVGAVGIWGMLAMGADFPLHVKSAALAANIVGGLIFGVGMALLGYCPGTGIAALGDGSRHVIPGLIGMVVGGGLFAELFPYISGNFMKLADVGKITLPGETGISPWWFIAALVVVLVVLMAALSKWERRPSVKRPTTPPAGA